MTLPSTTPVRLFRSDFLEWFSKVHPTTPFVLYVPVIAIALWLAGSQGQLSAGAMVGTFLGGLASWTITEYLLHRFVFHYAAHSSFGKRIEYIIHGVHHDDPHDPLRLVMPPAVSLCFAIFVYGLGLALHGYDSLCFVSGWVLGYLYYDFTHYVIHRRRGFRGFSFQRRNHLIHHFKDPTRCYGVTTSLWDHVFRTQYQAVTSE